MKMDSAIRPLCVQTSDRRKAHGEGPMEDARDEWEMRRLRRVCSQECRYQGGFREFALAEVSEAVKGTALGKSPGPDGVHAEVFRSLPAPHDLLL